MPIIELTDCNAPEAAPYFHLTDAQMRSRQEPEKGIFIAEGPKVIHTALDHAYEPQSILMRRKFLDGLGSEILARCSCPVFTADDDVLEAITGFRLQRSWVLSAMKRPKPCSPEQVLKNARCIAVLEGITEPSNLGAIFRSAAALGADAILLSPNCCDPFHRRAVRVSMGSIFILPWAQMTDFSDYALPSQYDFTTIGLALKPESIPLDDPKLQHFSKVALFLGTEDTGLSPLALDACDHLAIIPMAAGIDSLNVAAASAIAFWQFRNPTGNEAL
ncbi:MAG: RNA methyltransferase [Clostridia bacterium]|nr:RNA methyltransferase [Clostridia bacterium]